MVQWYKSLEAVLVTYTCIQLVVESAACVRVLDVVM
jgi:hypothetical protein